MAHLLAFFERGRSAPPSAQKHPTKPVNTPAYPASQPTPHAAPAVANNTTGIDLNAAIQKHSDWKVKLRTAIAHQEQLDAETITKDNCCDLGKWLHGDAKKQLGQLDHYVDCVSKHAAFHIEAGKVAAAINAKNLAVAEAMLSHNTPYAEASRLVCIAITQLQKDLKHPIPTATPSKPKSQLALTDDNEWSDF
jgi:methyl-accepting chemotaxis protein